MIVPPRNVQLAHGIAPSGAVGHVLSASAPRLVAVEGGAVVHAADGTLFRLDH